MGNGGFAMDTELVNASGTGINASGVNFQNEVNNFKSHVDAILGIWNGADADEFRRVAMEVAALLDRASITVQSVGTHLVNTANAVETTISDNKGNIGKII